MSLFKEDIKKIISEEENLEKKVKTKMKFTGSSPKTCSSGIKYDKPMVIMQCSSSSCAEAYNPKEGIYNPKYLK